MRTCKRCESEFPLDAFGRNTKGWYDVCRECAYPVCEKCGVKRTTRCPFSPLAKNQAKLCEKCDKKEKKTKARTGAKKK